jgi:hypothetical protein
VWSAQRILTAVFSVFKTEAVTISSKQLLNCTHEAEWTPFQLHYFSEKLVAPGTEPGTSGSLAWNYDHQTTQAVN